MENTDRQCPSSDLYNGNSHHECNENHWARKNWMGERNIMGYGTWVKVSAENRRLDWRRDLMLRIAFAY
ncbi:hypothetical protein TNCT_76041 [Trichonephila clavata]|uniref:Uncharacterized protein n=1 Tax=Trichonephila clavata TaxID=2740835 RepID=A0A8X6J302_TRICU|nr:hypothetical protein TNCT_76041 [Trichonephila clavata]